MFMSHSDGHLRDRFRQEDSRRGVCPLFSPIPDDRDMRQKEKEKYEIVVDPLCVDTLFVQLRDYRPW